MSKTTKGDADMKKKLELWMLAFLARLGFRP